MLLFNWFTVRVELLGCINILITSILFVYFKEIIYLTPNHTGLLIWVNLQLTNVFLLFGCFSSELEQCLLATKLIENYSITPQEVFLHIIYKKIF